MHTAHIKKREEERERGREGERERGREGERERAREKEGGGERERERETEEAIGKKLFDVVAVVEEEDVSGRRSHQHLCIVWG